MWTSLQHKIVKTRKPHRCAGCERTFLPRTIMLVSCGMWPGEIPVRRYYCLVCEQFIVDADLLKYDEELPDDNWMWSHDYAEQYAKTEAKLADYIRDAGAMTQRQVMGLHDMYSDLLQGVRWREWDAAQARKAATA